MHSLLFKNFFGLHTQKAWGRKYPSWVQGQSPSNRVYGTRSWWSSA